MQYVLSYDIVGLILLFLLLVLNYTMFKAPSRTASFYRAIILTAFFADFLDIFTIWTNQFTNTSFLLVLNNLLAIIHITLVGAVPMFYFLFVLSITCEQKNIPKQKLIFTAIVFAYDVLTIATSPFTKLVMYYDQNGTYLHGPLFVGTYVVVIIFVIAAIFELVNNFNNITKKQFFLVLAYTIIDIVCAIFQYIHPEVLLVGFSTATSLMVVAFALKSPIESLDNGTGVFNRSAFKDFLYSRSNNGVLVFIHINNANSIKYIHGLDNGSTIIGLCVAKMLNKCKQKLAFYVLNNTFVFPCKSEEDAKEKISILSQYKNTPLNIRINNDDEEIPVYIDSSIYIINDPQLLHKLTLVSSKKNPLDQIIDILQLMLEKNPNTNEVKIIGEEFIDYYKENIRIQQIVDVAIANESFEVFLQPIYDLKTKSFTGAESLIRLRDSTGKLISPGLFIPEAEKNGKILQLGDISIKKTCEFIQKGHLLELGIQKVNINLSMIQCMQDNIVPHLLGLLNKYDIPKDMIRFEITESITATNPEKLKFLMESLSAYGIEFALDDYGTGYSNTSRLLSFPFSEIKFDKSFVDSASDDERNKLPLKHLMNMVNDSKMIVLVEGIETKEMSDLIENYGGSLIQGFYYAKPLPLNEFVDFIKEKNFSK
ncbi:MAG: EAL domain-containing protein [Treponema sp.]|nr:EAL domain-containing protein [Treponema sp.]